MLSPVKIWRNQRKIQKFLGLTGEIISFTKVYVPPIGFAAQAPYVVAIAKMASGINFTAQLVDFHDDNLKTGQKVKTILRRISEAGEEGVIPYGIKFKPI